MNGPSGPPYALRRGLKIIYKMDGSSGFWATVGLYNACAFPILYMISADWVWVVENKTSCKSTLLATACLQECKIEKYTSLQKYKIEKSKFNFKILLWYGMALLGHRTFLYHWGDEDEWEVEFFDKFCAY